MSTFQWNKRAVLAVAVITSIGILAPASANAWDDPSGPDELVTISVDLGDGEDGGNGGDPDTCTGASTLQVPSSQITVTKERTFQKSIVSGWVDNDGANDTNNDGDYYNDPRPLSDVNIWEENTRTSYVSEPFTVTFDANNCPSSTDWAGLDFERQPVEWKLGTMGWMAVELTQLDGVMGPDSMRATSNLILNRGIVNGNVVAVEVFADIPWRDQGSIPDFIDGWGTRADDFNPFEEPQGTSGEAEMRAELTVFSDQPKGQFRVKNGISLWLD